MILFYMASFLSTRAKMKTVRIAYRFCFGHIVRNRTETIGAEHRPGGASKKIQVFGLGIFLSIAKAMAYHHDAVVYIIAARVRRISSRVSVYQKAFAMMIYNF